MQQQKFILKNKITKTVSEGIEAVESGVKTQATQTVKSTTGQFSGQNSQSPKAEPSASAQDLTREVVADFYEPSDPAVMAELSGKRLPKAGELTPEEEAKLRKLKQELHNQNYYNKLLERTSMEQEHQEEAQVEKEEEKMEELKVEEKKKQDQDIAVTMVTNRTEQFPGVAG